MPAPVPRRRSEACWRCEGGAPLRRRRRRPLRARARQRRRSGRRDGDRERRRRPRCARSRGLARPRQHPLRTCRPARRGARLGPLRRDLGGARAPSPHSVARTGSGSATATSGSISCGRRRCAPASCSRRDRPGSPGRSGSRRRSCRRRTTGCAPGSTRPPAASRSRSGSSRAATATRSTRFVSRVRRGRRRVCSKPSPEPMRS